MVQVGGKPAGTPRELAGSRRGPAPLRRRRARSRSGSWLRAQFSGAARVAPRPARRKRSDPDAIEPRRGPLPREFRRGARLEPRHVPGGLRRQPAPGADWWHGRPGAAAERSRSASRRARARSPSGRLLRISARRSGSVRCGSRGARSRRTETGRSGAESSSAPGARSPSQILPSHQVHPASRSAPDRISHSKGRPDGPSAAHHHRLQPSSREPGRRAGRGAHWEISPAAWSPR